MPNTLAGTSSPYLQQHADNPVDWQPWTPEVLEQAKAAGKPLLISIGYASCHWCHVMARESFEDEGVAEFMNEHFTCIKVDREERPDVDAIYMDALQQLTGRGGWPLHAFATPDGKPFFAGSYFPTEPQGDLPSWSMLIEAVVQAWNDRREEAEETGERLAAQLSGAARLESTTDIPGEDLLEQAIAGMQERFDSVNGGFGPAPKFPPTMPLSFLIRLHALPMARYTLTTMAASGLFDHVGGGFSRYCVDETWTVPHFEKMLYDNALLAQRYVEAGEATGEPGYGRIAERTLDWVIEDLGDDDGGFASGLDADAGGVEGSFYVWTPVQIRAVLDEADAEAAIRWLGVTEAGNFEGGATVLQAVGAAPGDEQAERITSTLAAHRKARRLLPGRDGKRIVSWNALTISALAASGVHLGRADHLAAAERCAELVLERAGDPRGVGRYLRLIPAEGDDVSVVPAGILDDHAHLLVALLDLYEATFQPRWLAAARDVASALMGRFHDEDGDGFWAVSDDHETLIARRKDLDDATIPSGQATAALGLLRLDALLGTTEHRAAVEGVLRLGATVAGEYPLGLGQMLIALDQYLAPPREIAIVGEGPAAEALLAVAREHAGAHAVIAAGPAGADGAAVPLLAGRELVDGQPAAYVCERFACQAPVTDPDALLELLD